MQKRRGAHMYFLNCEVIDPIDLSRLGTYNNLTLDRRLVAAIGNLGEEDKQKIVRLAEFIISNAETPPEQRSRDWGNDQMNAVRTARYIIQDASRDEEHIGTPINMPGSVAQWRLLLVTLNMRSCRIFSDNS